MERIVDMKTITKTHGVGMKLKEKGYGELKNYKGGGVTIIWGELDGQARRAGLFKLKSGKTEVVLNKHELQYLLRNV